DEAESLARRAAAIAEGASGVEFFTPDLLRDLGRFCDRLGETGAAEGAWRRCLADLEKAHGPSHPELLPVLNDLAALYDRLGRPTEAGPLWLRRLTIAEQTLAPDHPDLVDCLRAYAACCA